MTPPDTAPAPRHGARLSDAAGSARIPVRLWGPVLALGLVSQVAWTVENMYLPVFLYDRITGSPTTIAVMVAASATVATAMTLLVGAASDSAGTRRRFLLVLYPLWGVSICGFALLDVTALGSVALAAAAVIALDCVMTAFGAGGNDAAFMAWVTDSTTPANRGRIDALLATLPLLAMLLVFGALDPLVQAGSWGAFFLIVGLATGVIGTFTAVVIRDAPRLEATGTGLRGALQTLRPSVLRNLKPLLLALSAWAIIGTASQVFLPFLIIYVQRGLGLDTYPLILALVLTGAALLTVLGGRLIDRVGAERALLPSAVLFALGLLITMPARTTLLLIGAGIVMMGGFMLATAACSAAVRNATPAGAAGRTQGVRMIFVVLLPMVIGPFLGARVISGAGATYTELGLTRPVPTAAIFAAAAAVLLLLPLPALPLLRSHHRKADR